MSEQTSVGPNCSAAWTSSGERKIISVMPPGRAHERCEHGEAEGNAASALFGHWETVDAGNRMRRMAGQVEQDGADRTSVLGRRTARLAARILPRQSPSSLILASIS